MYIFSSVFLKFIYLFMYLFVLNPVILFTFFLILFDLMHLFK